MDGNELVVVDTNVAQAVDGLRGRRGSHAAQAAWIRRQAKLIDLRRFRPELPPYSPRLVQQALYVFRSKSNRRANGDPCEDSCVCGVPNVCPFGLRRRA